MKRIMCLGVVTLFGLSATVVTYEVRQERASLVVQDVGTNLYMLGNAPSVKGRGGG